MAKHSRQERDRNQVLNQYLIISRIHLGACLVSLFKLSCGCTPNWAKDVHSAVGYSCKISSCYKSFYTTLGKLVVSPPHSLIFPKPQDLHRIFPKSYISASGAAFVFCSLISQLPKTKGTVFPRGFNHKKTITPNSSALSKENKQVISYLNCSFKSFN